MLTNNLTDVGYAPRGIFDTSIHVGSMVAVNVEGSPSYNPYGVAEVCTLVKELDVYMYVIKWYTCDSTNDTYSVSDRREKI